MRRARARAESAWGPERTPRVRVLFWIPSGTGELYIFDFLRARTLRERPVTEPKPKVLEPKNARKSPWDFRRLSKRAVRHESIEKKFDEHLTDSSRSWVFEFLKFMELNYFFFLLDLLKPVLR